MQYILLRHFWAVKRNLRSYTQTKKHLRDLPIAGDIFVVNQSGKEKPLGNNVHITHNLWVLFHETINWDKSNSHYERKQRWIKFKFWNCTQCCAWRTGPIYSKLSFFCSSFFFWKIRFISYSCIDLWGCVIFWLYLSKS